MEESHFQRVLEQRKPLSFNPMFSNRQANAKLLERTESFERLRHQEFLTPAAISMIVLLLSGYIPALMPVFVPAMAIALLPCILLFVAAWILNRRNQVQAAIYIYILGQLLFYSVALYITPTGPRGQLSITNFTAGNLYYFLADVLPSLASVFLLELRQGLAVNVLVWIANEVCIWVLPHDVTFLHFVANLGGPLFLAASATIGQAVLVVFGLAASRAIRQALLAASQAADIEEANARIAERQKKLEEEISLLQEAHASISNGKMPNVSLNPTSELYPIMISLNLMVERLLRLAREGQDLQNVEHGLMVAIQMLHRILRGDLSHPPRPTGTRVDGLIALLLQLRGQLGNMALTLDRFSREMGQSQQTIFKSSSDLISNIDMIRNDIMLSQSLSSEASTALYRIKLDNEKIAQNIRTHEKLEREVASVIGQFVASFAGNARPLDTKVDPKSSLF